MTGDDARERRLFQLKFLIQNSRLKRNGIKWSKTGGWASNEQRVHLLENPQAAKSIAGKIIDVHVMLRVRHVKWHAVRARGWFTR